MEIKNISPFLGAIVSGVQISQLTSEGLDELALLAAEKKVVAFRDQDFKDLSPERQIEIARCDPCINSEWNKKLTLTLDVLDRHFGPIQVHPTSGNVKDFPEFHVGKFVQAPKIDLRVLMRNSRVVYRDANHDRFSEYRGGNRANKTSWHSDVVSPPSPNSTPFLSYLISSHSPIPPFPPPKNQSYERQPPGTTFFWILDQPENGGGDTLFLSQVEAYKRLSPEFQKRLEGLRAVHSAVEQAEFSRKRGGPVRREPVETEVS